MLWGDSLWQNYISKRGPSVFSLKWSEGVDQCDRRKWPRSVFSSIPFRCLTSRRQISKWLTYVPGLCGYPDVRLMIKRTRRKHFIPLPCFWSYFLLCCQDRLLAGDESWCVEHKGKLMGDASTLSESLRRRERNMQMNVGSGECGAPPLTRPGTSSTASKACDLCPPLPWHPPFYHPGTSSTDSSFRLKDRIGFLWGREMKWTQSHNKQDQWKNKEWSDHKQIWGEKRNRRMGPGWKE